MVENFKQTEIGAIPHDWDVKNIVEFSTMKARIGWQGLTVSEYLDRGDYFLITGTDLVDGRIKWDTCHFVNKDRFIQDKNIQIKAGDILITKDGTIGKIAYVDSLTIPATLNSGVFVIRPKKEAYLPIFLFYIFNSSYFRDFLNKLVAGSTISHLYQKDFTTFNFPLPPTKSEQTAIATALNNADALISSLEKLIAKKKAIKQGAMQELLKPKEGWDWTTVEKLGKPYGGLSGKSKNDFNAGNCPYIPFMNVMSNPIIDKSFLRYVKIGSSENQNKAMKGDIFFNGSSETPEELGMCSVLLEDIPNLYLNSFCFGFRLNKELGTDGLYLAYYFRSSFGRRIFTILAQGATRHNLSKANFNKIEFQLPKPVEQKRISEIISDMDNEIFEIETKLEKQKLLKQGMMQSLLTGKIRLNKQQELPQTIGLKPKKSLNHNHYFEDAVLIAAIVNHFYSEKYVLGRKKVQKLLYLLRRKQEADTNAFKRKAAGPYADEVRYKGGEPIAKNKKYINISSNKLGSIFSKGEQIGEALDYIEKWGMNSDINWLVSQFKFETIDQLELLATIDMAIFDLEKDNKVASLENIKNLIKSDKEWKAKLEREIFSDGNIRLAIRQRFDLFE